ncbi:MAG: hypothetical protein NTV80_17905 [Verrucomicrobia bacterium]|jgi:hypothetical protein|nr:hypothetical protein [Verrucomicrobiota bacterium]
MKLSNTFRLGFCLAGLAAFASASKVKAQSGACDDISRDVASAVQKDPSKVLMVVEDALVINEACSCEIIKAAITASNADAALVNQIVQTAISVAPKMSGVIMDCATSVSPGAVAPNSGQMTAVTASGKDVKNPLPVIAPPAEEEDFNPIPSSIRGIYLVQPPAGGFIPRDPNPRKCDKDCISPTQSHPYYP